MFPQNVVRAYGPLPPRHNVRWPEVCKHNPTMMQRMHAYGDCGFECAQVQLMGNRGTMYFHPGRYVVPTGIMVASPGRQFREMHDWRQHPEIRERMQARERHYRMF